MRLILIRHAETTWNRQGRLQGTADSPLTPEGVAQARLLQPALQRLGIEHAIASDLPRAQTTAQHLRLRPLTIDPAWREADLGEWTGTLAEDIPAVTYQAWRHGKTDPPGGEGHEQLRRRVANALRHVNDGTTAVVTHGGVIRAVLDLWLGLKPANLAPPTPSGVTILDHSSQVRLVAYNLNPQLLTDTSDIR